MTQNTQHRPRNAGSRWLAGLPRLLLLIAVGLGSFLLGKFIHEIHGGHRFVPRGPHLEAHVLDVGAGSSQLIVTPAGHALLIDAGPRDRPAAEASAILGKDGAVDLFILTSTRPGCIGGFRDVLRSIRLRGPVLLPTDGKTFSRAGRAARDVLAALHEAGVLAYPYDQYLLSHPSPIKGESLLQIAGLPVVGQARIEQSIALRIEYGASSLLYAGGIDAAESRQLLSRNSNLACDVLTAPGGGSYGAASPELLAATGPQAIAVSCGADRPPDTDALRWMQASGARIGRTDQLGTFTLHVGSLPNQAVNWPSPADRRPE